DFTIHSTHDPPENDRDSGRPKCHGAVPRSGGSGCEGFGLVGWARAGEIGVIITSCLARIVELIVRGDDLRSQMVAQKLEFFYIQMEKYARQAVADGCKHADDLFVNRDSELFRHLNLHYNRNNQIEAPESFRVTVESTLREFFRAIFNKKDLESSWKKAIYKVIARMDEQLPEFFKAPNWMDQLGEVP
ncbi:hypothetical protein BaRGS_00003294, partial [Batillaria attramentaria]